MLTLYYATNTCALASHIALEEAGAAFETRWVDFGAAEQTKPEYLKINPKGRVPALVTEQRRADRNARHSRLYRAKLSARLGSRRSTIRSPLLSCRRS